MRGCWPRAPAEFGNGSVEVWVARVATKTSCIGLPMLPVTVEARLYSYGRF